MNYPDEIACHCSFLILSQNIKTKNSTKNKKKILYADAECISISMKYENKIGKKKKKKLKTFQLKQ